MTGPGTAAGFVTGSVLSALAGAGCGDAGRRGFAARRFFVSAVGATGICGRAGEMINPATKTIAPVLMLLTSAKAARRRGEALLT